MSRCVRRLRNVGLKTAVRRLCSRLSRLRACGHGGVPSATAHVDALCTPDRQRVATELGRAHSAPEKVREVRASPGAAGVFRVVVTLPQSHISYLLVPVIGQIQNRKRAAMWYMVHCVQLCNM